MKVNELKQYLDATIDLFGDIDVFLDFDPDDEDMYEIDGVYCETSRTGNEDTKLVLSCYKLKVALSLVK